MEQGWLLLAAAAAAAAAAAFALGWLLARRRATAAQARLEAARADGGKERALKEQLQEQLAQERARGQDGERELREQLRAARERAAAERAERAAANAQLAERARSIAELQEAQRHQQAELRNDFKLLSQEVLDRSQRELAARSREGLEGLLSPLRTQLDAFRKRADELHDAQTKERSAMREQIAQLGKQQDGLRQGAEDLAQALRQDKKALGNWGEVQVERLLEMSGLERGREYLREPGLRSEEGRLQRPDFVIKLPEGKHLIIDSKVSLNDYLASVQAMDDDARRSALAAHVECVRQHIDTLSERGYARLPELQAPDFVFMFMPIEPAYLAAFEADPGLFERAYERKVAVVVPNTLLPILRTVHSLWRIDKRNRSAVALADAAAKVHDKLCVFSERFEQLGKQIDKARKEYDSARVNLSVGRGNLIRTAESFKQLGVKASKTMSAALVEDSQSDSAPPEGLPELEPEEPPELEPEEPPEPEPEEPPEPEAAAADTASR